MFDWAYGSSSNNMLCSNFGDARIAAAGTILSDEDLFALVPAQQLKENKVAMSPELLKNEVVQSTNSFGHLSKAAQTQAMKDMVEDQKSMKLLVSEMKDSRDAIRAILMCDEIQDHITIDHHVRKGSSQQYSLARIPTSPELLHRLTIQLWFEKKALEEILSCDAVKAGNSFDRLHEEKQARAISMIQSKPELLKVFTTQPEKNEEAVRKILHCTAIKSANTSM
jgi:hypothetical protein